MSSCGGAISPFNYAAWQNAYPQFSNVTEQQATTFWNLAGILLRNDGTGPVRVQALQNQFIWLIMAHLAFLLVGDTSGNGNTGLVGRISGATEGSVSAQADMGVQPASAAWWLQTQYGAMFWQMTAAFRTFRWIPGGPQFGGAFGGFNYAGFGNALANQPWLYPAQNQGLGY